MLTWIYQEEMCVAISHSNQNRINIISAGVKSVLLFMCVS